MSDITVPGLDDLYDALKIPDNPAGARFRELGTVVSFSRGTKLPLFIKGEAQLYMLLQGCTYCETPMPDGRTLLECICYQIFDAVNPIGMFTGTYKNESCTCLQDSVFAVFPMEEIIRLVEGDVELMNVYSGCLKRGLEEQTRYKYMLSLRSDERYAWFLNSFGSVAEHIPMKVVAQLLNVDPATLSRIRAKLKGE